MIVFKDIDLGTIMEFESDGGDVFSISICDIEDLHEYKEIHLNKNEAQHLMNVLEIFIKEK